MYNLLIKLLFLLTLALPKAFSCELFERTIVDGLSKQWNQEYTGADLVSAYLKKHKVRFDPDLVETWDNNFNEHRFKVGNIIAGPYSSSLIPYYGSTPFRSFYKTKDAFTEGKSIEDLYGKSLPHYINVSMPMEGTDNSALLSKMVEMAKRGTVFIVSAGNDDSFVYTIKDKLKKEANIILVASVNAKGYPSKFNSVSKAVTIAAPADHFVWTADRSGDEYFFGGTSAATPQVTAALAMFTTLTKYKLSAKEAHRLLVQTAQKSPVFPAPHFLGAGMLNVYRIFKVAQKLNNSCSSEDCIEKSLKLSSTYLFKNKAPLSLDRASFEGLSCESKKDYLAQIRSLILSNDHNAVYADFLASILDEHEYCQNSLYYSKVSSSNKRSDEGLIKDLIANEEDANLVKYVLSYPGNRDRKDLVDEIEKKGLADVEILFFLLKNKKPENYDLVYESIIKTSFVNDLIADSQLFKENSIWKTFYRKRLDLKGFHELDVTSENIREHLLTK